MNHTYEWLYDYYAEPRLNKIFATEKQTLVSLIQEMELSPQDKVRLSDTVTALRLRWGAEAFALGVQMGARLVGAGAVNLPTVSAD